MQDSTMTETTPQTPPSDATSSGVYPDSQPIPFQYELAVIGEECGEVMQMVGKTMRFGLDSYSPVDPTKRTNHQLLHDEIGDILAGVEFATERGLLDRETLVNRMFAKRKKLHAMAPNPILPTATVFETPKSVHPAVPITTICLLLLVGIAIFFLARETVQPNDTAMKEKITTATAACYEKYHDARCNDIADLVGIKPAPLTNSASPATK
jgi:NTP pyrophosphatase (non-canonical NTP hydrolase)